MRKLRSGVIDAKQDMWRMPASFVGFYAEQDAAITLKLWHQFKPEIMKQSLNDVWEMEMELLPTLINMRQQGIRINEQRHMILKKNLEKKNLRY
jgi:DNA polymerase I-like protein with 3'-5' exonuclease and polymerase domains